MHVLYRVHLGELLWVVITPQLWYENWLTWQEENSQLKISFQTPVQEPGGTRSLLWEIYWSRAWQHQDQWHPNQLIGCWNRNEHLEMVLPTAASGRQAWHGQGDVSIRCQTQERTRPMRWVPIPGQHWAPEDMQGTASDLLNNLGVLHTVLVRSMSHLLLCSSSMWKGWLVIAGPLFVIQQYPEQLPKVSHDALKIFISSMFIKLSSGL